MASLKELFEWGRASEVLPPIELFNQTYFGSGYNSYFASPFKYFLDDSNAMGNAWPGVARLIHRSVEDGRRGHEIIAIYYKEKPVSILCRAGRE